MVGVFDAVVEADGESDFEAAVSEQGEERIAELVKPDEASGSLGG